MTPLRLRVEGRLFRDSKNREVTLRGINCAGDAKLPKSPDLPSHIPENFYEGDDVSFVGRPFSVDEAHTHFGRLARWGYNTMRYIFTWEAIEHKGPGQYDEEWIKHTIKVLRLAKDYGFYIFMDPHQDVWSRFTGGSGAPMWTLYAMGLNPKTLGPTEAAWVHNTYSNPAEYPKMIWSTNYTRLACQVAFTLFFAGRDFAPKAIIDGKNIQDYLQDHYIAAVRHLAQRLHEAGDIENDVVIGWESMNEPNRGLVGWPDLSAVPGEQKLQKGTSPTAWQAILTGSGRACEIDTWDIGGLGPYKTGSTLVDPNGVSAWLPADFDDTKYGWKRDPGWKLGECLWAQHGIWDPTNDKLTNQTYFSKEPGTGKTLDYELFTNRYFMGHYRKYRDAIKSVHPDSIMFCQPPVLEIPPSIKNTEDDDPNMVYSPHFYDGITLLTKKWNRYWNVDVFGILRGRYLSPAFAVKIGETAIRNCFRDQLSGIRREGLDYMGNHPCVFTEIGIPYDMDDKYAYKTGDFTSQSLAMDANHFALEGSGVNGFALWVYVTTNNHKWGDNWNGEDLSIFSLSDVPLPLTPHSSNSTKAGASTTSLSVDPSSPSYSQSRASPEHSDSTTTSPQNLKSHLSTPSISSSSLIANKQPAPAENTSSTGYRGAEAYVRPSPISTFGDVVNYGFDLRNATFTLTVKGPPKSTQEQTEELPTEVFLPEFHFPRESCQVDVSAGKWSISTDAVGGIEGRGIVQRLRWWHGAGEQKLTLKGVQRRQNMSLGKEEEEGYLDQCQQRKCEIM
ncbi:hypothetical protein MMC25_001435 [Agyrium rufum]|nr:hypothetical protein [Agyrium rufum]